MDTTTPNEETPEPNVPAELADSPQAVECWTLNYSEVAKGGELTPAEENALIRYCLLWAEWLDTADNIKKFGKVIPKKNAAGDVVSYKDRPEVARQRGLDVSLRQLEKSLGLDSGSRRRDEEEEDAADQPKSSRGRADHLKKYQFKKGQSGNPKGLPKGRVSLTTKLKKLFQLPVRDGKKRANKNYTYADRFVEVMMEAALAKDFKFAKEIFERVEGKVPDHLVMESTKQMVAQEVGKFAHSMVTLVEEISRSLLDDKDADDLMAALHAKVVAKFTEEISDGEVDEEGGESQDEIPPAVPGDGTNGQGAGIRRGGLMGMLDRLSELIQRSKKQRGVGAVTDCDIVWPSKSAEEHAASLASVNKFEIEGVELIVDGDTLRIRPKTGALEAPAVQSEPVAEVSEETAESPVDVPAESGQDEDEPDTAPESEA